MLLMFSASAGTNATSTEVTKSQYKPVVRARVRSYILTECFCAYDVEKNGASVALASLLPCTAWCLVLP